MSQIDSEIGILSLTAHMETDILVGVFFKDSL